MERFDPRDPEAHFAKITKLKQEGDIEDYIAEYLQLSIMVSNLTMSKKVCMFVNGMVELLQGLVKFTKPTTLLEAVEKSIDLQHILPRARTFYNRRPTHGKGRQYMFRNWGRNVL